MTTATLLFSLALASFSAQERLTVPQANDFTVIKDLYASASFEEALTRLSTMEADVPIEQAEQYRALCLLGLGRTNEAQQSLERMVIANPLYTIPDSEVSPRLVSMFREIRKRLLPTAARDLYQEAKTNFDAKRYGSAATQFAELMGLLDDADMRDQAEGLKDLRLLGEGFRKLAEAEVTTARRTAEQQAAAAEVARQQEAVRAPTVFADGDAGVVAPIEIERRMPVWTPPAAIARLEHRGLLEIVINERGQVESAVLRRSVAALYDATLIGATKAWKFRPATRGGVPVKYRKSFEIVLSARP